MEESAKQQGKTVWEVAEYYTNAFKNDVIRLNIFPPDFTPKQLITFSSRSIW
ncbi:MAG: hypothetical protein R3A12_02970 [Ignavibacteria bacterium]